MSDYDDSPQKGNGDCIDLESRDVRALTEVMSVLPDQPEVRGADEMFLVVTESGSQYTVDLRTDACTCPDATHRNPDGGCKHVRRCRIEMGRESIDREELDDGLKRHIEEEPKLLADGSGTVHARPVDDAPRDGRPDDCRCINWNVNQGPPCWPCFRDSFETPASTDD